MNATITERVAAGAAFLDEHDPEWWRADVERAIDLDVLELADGRVRILGQRCPLDLRTDDHEPYTMFGRALSGMANGYAVDNWGRSFGFIIDRDVQLGHLGAEWDALTAEWKSLIEARRSA